MQCSLDTKRFGMAQIGAVYLEKREWEWRLGKWSQVEERNFYDS